MRLPYRYKMTLEVEIEGNGLHASGDGAKATADRLADLLKTDPRVISVNRWPEISYEGKSSSALDYLDNEAGNKTWRGEK